MIAQLESGGYKGYGLGMMVELFAGLLSGATLSPDARPWNDRGQVADLVSLPIPISNCDVCGDS
jgi:LDH2 family malate/lactate/ureidoglycolate dehydrogenase